MRLGSRGKVRQVSVWFVLAANGNVWSGSLGREGKVRSRFGKAEKGSLGKYRRCRVRCGELGYGSIGKLSQCGDC